MKARKIFTRQFFSILLALVLLVSLVPANLMISDAATTTSVKFEVKSWNASSETVSTTTQTKTATVLTKDDTSIGMAGSETYYVVSSDVSLSKLTINGTVHLILDANYTATGNINVGEGSTLHIHKKVDGGSATLTAKNIGSVTAGEAVGNIYIHGGTVVTSGVIGTAELSNFDKIVIYDGTVTAGGIGGSLFNSSYPDTPATGTLIGIYGGKVISKNVERYGPGIGAGRGSTLTTLEIYNANVTARIGLNKSDTDYVANYYASALGGNDTVQKVLIKNATVEARNVDERGFHSYAIGSKGDVTILNSKVDAYAGGKGGIVAREAVKMSGSTVTVKSSERSARTTTQAISGKTVSVDTSNITVAMYNSSHKYTGVGIYATESVTINSGTIDLGNTTVGISVEQTDGKVIINGGNIKKSGTTEFEGVTNAVNSKGDTLYYVTATVTATNRGGSDIVAGTTITEIVTDDGTAYGVGTNTKVIDAGKFYMYLPAATDVLNIKSASTTYGGVLSGTTTKTGTYYAVCVCTTFQDGVCTVCGTMEPPEMKDGYYLIYDANDWKYVANAIAGTLTNGSASSGKVNMKLMNNISTNVSIGSEKRPFKGIFDGNGYTLNSGTSPFSVVDGATIKNLTFTGDRSFRFTNSHTSNGKVNGKYGGLVVTATGAPVTFEKCMVKASYTFSHSTSSRTVYELDFGALVGYSDTDVTVNNCAYIGTIVLSNVDSFSCMVGKCDPGATVTVSNSYVYVEKYSPGYHYHYIDAFSHDDNTGSINNCYVYYNNPTGYSGSVSSGDGGKSAKAEEFANGTVTYKLNGGNSNGVWKQTLEGDTPDALPNFTGKNVTYNYATKAYDNHTHDYSYALATVNTTDDTIAMTCSTCGTLNVTLTPPSKAVYTPGASVKYWTVSVSNQPADTTVVYYENNKAMDTAPYQAGTYTAKLTLGGKTASVTYSVAKYSTVPTVSVSGTVTDVTKPADVTLVATDNAWANYIDDYTIELVNTDALYYDQSEYEFKVTVKDTRNIESPLTGKVSIDVQDTTKADTLTIQIDGVDVTSGEMYFYKEGKTVTLSATDNERGSGIKAFYYYVANDILTEEELESVEWSEAKASETTKFNLSGNQTAYVYAKVCDNAGNYSDIVSTKKIVLYTDSAQDTGSISFIKTVKENVEATVKLNGNTVDKIYNGTTLLEKDVDYSVDENGKISFGYGYLDSLKGSVEGTEYTLTVHYNPRGETFVESAVNEAPLTTDIALKVYKCEATISSIEDLSAVYDGEAVSNPEYTTTSDGTVTIEWYKDSISDQNKLEGAPKNAGDYVVLVKIAESDNYKYVEASSSFTISPKMITIIGAEVAETKDYDGNTKAAITEIGSLSENYDGEKLSFTVGSAAYDNKNVGDDKQVVFSGFALTGEAKDNYILAQPADTTADIKQKAITITLSVNDKQYDGRSTATYKDTPALVGVVDADREKVVLTNGIPTFSNVQVGEKIAIQFTEFVISGEEAYNYKLTQPTGITADIYNNYDAAENVDYTVSKPNDEGWLREDFVITACDGYQICTWQ